MAIIFHEVSQIFTDTLPGISLSHQEAKVSGGHLPPHWHERMEIWLIREGQMTISCDRDIFDVIAGDVLIFNPGEVHSCRVTKAPSSIECAIFDLTSLLTNRPADIDPLIRSISWGKVRFQHIVRKNEDVHRLIEQLTECNHATPINTMRAEGLLLQLLSVLLEGYVSVKTYSVPHHLQEVSSLLEYIHEHLADDISLENLANRACMSPSYFCRWFKGAVGESPMAYVTTLRINKAYELLSNGCSVTETCHKVGIDDLNNFNRQFRKRVGVSPSKIKAETKRG